MGLLKFGLGLFVMLALLLLGGCFMSSAPLITPADADYPFDTITYEFGGEDDRVKLVKIGDAYEAPDEQGDGRLLLKLVAANTYLVQAEFSEDEEQGFLYTVAKLSPDGKTAEIILPYARQLDLQAAKQGKAGFTLCSGDASSVCLTSSQAYVEYALAAESDEKRLVNILEMK